LGGNFPRRYSVYRAGNRASFLGHLLALLPATLPACVAIFPVVTAFIEMASLPALRCYHE